MSEIKCFTGALESFIEADRLPVIDAVCDAIEGFCEDRCSWNVDMDRFETACGYIYFQRFGHHCPACGRHVVEQFDILKEEGV